jgi:hypothetical protein
MADLKIYFGGISIGHFLIWPRPTSASIDIGVCVDDVDEERYLF